MRAYIEYAVETILALLNTPSPTGHTLKAQQLVLDTLTGMGYSPVHTRKGTVLCELGGEGHPLLLAAHIDTLGAVVRSIKPNGALRYMHVGGYDDATVMNENCLVYASSGRVYTGTVRDCKASRHVYGDTSAEKKGEDAYEVTLDETVYTAEDTRACGVEPGDTIAFDARTILTDSGFIKSRHLDDKASAGILLALAKAVKEQAIALSRKVTIMFTVYEEVGHGASGLLPEGITDLIAVDMGCVGDDLSCRETQVSICIKDSAGPFDETLTRELVKTAKANGIDYAKDVYPFYSSDTATALKAGLEARHALIGPGVYASHSYERTHVKGVEQTFALLWHTIRK